MKKTNKKGFTIVELVIVIAVIAILAAVLIPTFAGVVEKANKNATLQEARNIYTQLLADDIEDGVQDAAIKGTAMTTDQLKAYNPANVTTAPTYTATGNPVVVSFSYTNRGFTASYNGTTWTVSTAA